MKQRVAISRTLLHDPAVIFLDEPTNGLDPQARIEMRQLLLDLARRGKTLIVRYVTTSEPHEDGTRTVFFELNGQPRSVRIADRSLVATRPPPRKVEAGNPQHIGAPMPGVIATVTAVEGAKVTQGEVLLTLEAMKMETVVRASNDGEVAEVLARPGQSVEAKDLLIVLS